ncbi:general transcription factor II-I repeat domain-containing protein 2 [Trichonephila clavata]|uniref:General transcription factor II-I repeat domain-containing protein 2 n=1 Tax=Trichonephila clavata TaxID=2740835 RepID=A0A8X6FQB4_TRICU|nr:general transcription factor II-I repeat domain-containing protein 2 [Trichonephila clavata]
MKRGLKSQQSSFTKLKTEQEAATRASFRVALEIAKRGKPFTNGEIIKECIIAVAEEMCPEKVHLLKTVSMSANTVARRVETSLKIYPLNCSTKMDMLSGFLWPWMSQRMCQILLRC